MEERKIAEMMLVMISMMDRENREYIKRNIILPNEPLSKEAKHRKRQNMLKDTEEAGAMKDIYGTQMIKNKATGKLKFIPNDNLPIPDGYERVVGQKINLEEEYYEKYGKLLNEEI